ncbi:alpha-hydroxy-acid oxidizing protein [Tardiphaga sp. 813_E8_N1_3]|uniref:alpha-hydroxy-acid oxidizing protein n=1 Tax=Tardiphaga sp. 813_E8_N1_3 TaxID=3240760 RepID=UPI003F20CB7F
MLLTPPHRRCRVAIDGHGRPYVWGLASFGEAGVDRVLQILDDEFITIMRQVGALDINHITRRCVTSF